MKKYIAILVVIIASILLYLLFWPTRIDPVSYRPAKKPEMAGVLSQNNELAKAELLAKGKINGPEDVVIDSEGRIYGGTQDGKIVLFDMAAKTVSKTVFEEPKNAVTALAYNHKGNWFVSGDSKGNVKIWDTKNYTLLETLEGHRSRIYDIDFSPDDNLVASSSLDGTVRMWDCENINNQPVVLTDHASWVLSIAFSPDGKRLVTSSNQKERILVWSTEADLIAKEVKTFLERNLTIDEWNVFVAKDVEYEKTFPELAKSN